MLKNFIKWLEETNKSKSKYITVITSNYDYALEWNLLNWGEAWDVDEIVDYGFSWRDPILKTGQIHYRPVNSTYKIYKLHGSSDWLKCERCGYIYINPTMEMYQLAFVNYKTDANTCHCGYWPLKPVLVTPSFARLVFDTNLHEIWKACLEQLRTADEWIIVGYSLPAEDLNIKSLFLRALHGRIVKPRIQIIQNNTSSQSRYNNFFGVNEMDFNSDRFEKYSLFNMSK